MHRDDHPSRRRAIGTITVTAVTALAALSGASLTVKEGAAVAREQNDQPVSRTIVQQRGCI